MLTISKSNTPLPLRGRCLLLRLALIGLLVELLSAPGTGQSESHDTRNRQSYEDWLCANWATSNLVRHVRH
jgi:hypothetical protein